MAVSEVEVLCPVVIDADYIAIRIIAEQLLHLARAAALYLRHEQAAVVAERCGDFVYCFARTHSLLIIGIASRGTVAAYTLQPLPLPAQRVTSVILSLLQ